MNSEVPGAADGRRTRWDAHRAARRDDLITAAVRSIARHGADVGMDRIAEEAGTSKPVVYRYFADKTQLHRAVTQRIVGTILTTLRDAQAADADPRGLIQHSIEAYLGLLEHNPELYRFVIDHPHLEADDGRTPRTFSDVIAGLLADRLGRALASSGLDPALAHPWGEAIVGFTSSASLWWLEHPDAMTRRQLADYLTALLWGGAAGMYQYAGAAPATRPADGSQDSTTAARPVDPDGRT